MRYPKVRYDFEANNENLEFREDVTDLEHEIYVLRKILIYNDKETSLLLN